MAILSSGSPLAVELLLVGTLRYIAGASYLDIVDFYKFPETSGHEYFWRTLTSIDNQINNIKLPQNADDWEVLEKEWSDKMVPRKRNSILRGTVLAIDGLIRPTRAPTYLECRGNVNGQFNRKGYHGMVAICAVDVWGRFKCAELNCTGSTHDVNAFELTPLYD